jgi:hypothetical protein
MDHLARVAAEAEVLNVYKERSEPDMEMKIVEEAKGNDQHEHEHEVHAAAMGIPRGFFRNTGTRRRRKEMLDSGISVNQVRACTMVIS